MIHFNYGIASIVLLSTLMTACASDVANRYYRLAAWNNSAVFG
jgi:hypothetical protein